MIFEKTLNIPAPKQGELKNALQTMQNNPEDLTDRELWILKEFVGGGIYE